MKVFEILDEHNNHVCWMDEDCNVYKTMERKEIAKNIGVAALKIGGACLKVAAGVTVLWCLGTLCFRRF